MKNKISITHKLGNLFYALLLAVLFCGLRITSGLAHIYTGTSESNSIIYACALRICENDNQHSCKKY